MSRLTRDGTAEPVSRDQILRHARGQGNIMLPVQLTTSRIGNLTRLIHTLLYVMSISVVMCNLINTYIHTYQHGVNIYSIQYTVYYQVGSARKIVLNKKNGFSSNYLKFPLIQKERNQPPLPRSSNHCTCTVPSITRNNLLSLLYFFSWLRCTYYILYCALEKFGEKSQKYETLQLFNT